MRFVITVIALSLALVMTSGCATSNSAARQKGMSEVAIEVTNIDNGVTVKVTSEKPERVKMIQKHWAEKQEAHRRARQTASSR